MVETFYKSCPDSFSGINGGMAKIDGYDAQIFMLGCGEVVNPVVATGKGQSESVLIIVIKGVDDYYNIQWAERGKPTKEPIQVSQAKWVERFKSFFPIKLCSRIEGEPAPYPSCLKRL